MHTIVKTGLPQMETRDFQARACTTSRWLWEEIVKGAPRSPLPIATRGCKSKPAAAGVPRTMLCFSALSVGDALGPSGGICVATATPPELASLPALEAICEDSGSTGTGRATPMRFSCWTTRSGSTIGPLLVFPASMCTLLSHDDRASIPSITFVATSDPESPKLNLKLSERPKPEPKEIRVLVACGVGVQDICPEFSPRLPATHTAYP